MGGQRLASGREHEIATSIIFYARWIGSVLDSRPVRTFEPFHELCPSEIVCQARLGGGWQRDEGRACGVRWLL